jgi:hypothetical protein
MASTSLEVVAYALQTVNAATVTYVSETLCYDYPSILNIITIFIRIFAYHILALSNNFLKI